MDTGKLLRNRVTNDRQAALVSSVARIDVAPQYFPERTARHTAIFFIDWVPVPL
jgi:hypothetical protein